MVNSCSAYGCKNRNAKGSQITFHRFPLNNKSLLKLWLYQIKRGNWEPSKYSVICSEHFTEDCFVVKGVQNSRRTLKSDAYPTIFSMAIYSEPPKKKTFPAKKITEDIPMNEEESKEETASATEGSSTESTSANGNEGAKEENLTTKGSAKGESMNEEENVSAKKDAEGESPEKMEETPVEPKSNTDNV